MKAVLLDFNGTMFFDSSFHKEAWSKTYQELYPNDTNPPDPTRFLGPRNEVILKNMAPFLNAEELDWWSEHKEELYRQICRNNPEKLHLVPGTEELLNHLKNKGIPFALASASIRANILFYFETFGLDRWFKLEDIVYDDGTYPDKGAMHLEAARRLHTDISQCLLVEDSPSSIAAAKKLGAGCIIAIGDTAPAEKLLSLGADHFIPDFSQFDFAWL